MAEITAQGGEAFAHGASVTDDNGVQAMVAETLSRWGRVDILVNNAGILRDKTFSKLTLAEFREVIDVHLMGSVICTKAVWEAMRAQRYGRVVMTTSSSGLFGNFGQSNYAAAKMALVGLAQTLALEGMKHGIRVNCFAPTAATRMLEGLLPAEALSALAPAAAAAGLSLLVAEDAPTRMILCAGAGGFEAAHITLTRGVFLGSDDDVPDRLPGQLAAIADRLGETVPDSGAAQITLELGKAGFKGGGLG